MKTRTGKIIITSMLAALVCVATMIIKIPSPLKGYINLGDCVVLLCGWTLSPAYAFFAAGIGSMLADVFSGYILYSPATLVIKGLMAVFACLGYKLLIKNSKENLSRILSGLGAEIIMAVGYFLFEGVLYGFVPSLVNIPANIVQGVAGLVLGVILIKIFKKNNILNVD